MNEGQLRKIEFVLYLKIYSQLLSRIFNLIHYRNLKK